MSPGYLEESTVNKQRVPTLVLPALAICFLVCRLISRGLKRLPIGVDDYTLIVGLVGRAIGVPSIPSDRCLDLRYIHCRNQLCWSVSIYLSVSTFLTLPATYYGMGRHMAAVMQEGFNTVTYMKVSIPPIPKS